MAAEPPSKKVVLIEKLAKYGIVVLSSRDPDNGTTRFVRFELALLSAVHRAALHDAKRDTDIRDLEKDPSGVFELLNDVIDDNAEPPEGWAYFDCGLGTGGLVLPEGETFGLFNHFYYG